MNRGLDGTPVYLVGDSNGIHFSDAVLGASSQLGSPVSFATASGCPFVISSTPPDSDEGCSAFVAGTVDWLTTQNPGIVVIASSDHYWADIASFVALGGTGLAGSREEQERFLERQLQVTVERLLTVGHRVVLAQTIPRFSERYAWSPNSCSIWVVAQGDCAQQMPLDWANMEQSLSRSVIQRVGAATGASTIDFRSEFCGEGVCQTQSQAMLNYRDGRHLTVAASKALVPQFTDVLSRLQ